MPLDHERIEVALYRTSLRLRIAWLHTKRFLNDVRRFVVDVKIEILEWHLRRHLARTPRDPDSRP